MQFYNCLAIEPNPKNRALLKHAMTFVPQFNSAKIVRNTRYALEIFTPENDFDLIFISDKLEKNVISEFIKNAKKTEIGAMAGYVLLSSKVNDAEAVAKSLLTGIDGVLIEPYSIDSLQELSLLAARVRLQKEEEKKRSVLKFLTSNVIYCVDIMAQAIILKHNAPTVRKTINKINEFIVSSEYEGLLTPYLNILSESFMEIEKPVVIVQEDRYKGSSERVKKHAKREVVDELESKISEIGEKIDNKNFEDLVKSKR